MPTCKNCINFRSKDELEGYCTASENDRVEADRDSIDCVAAAFKPKEENKDLV